jgi:hypothetical protein
VSLILFAILIYLVFLILVKKIERVSGYSKSASLSQIPKWDINDKTVYNNSDIMQLKSKLRIHTIMNVCLMQFMLSLQILILEIKQIPKIQGTGFYQTICLVHYNPVRLLTWFVGIISMDFQSVIDIVCHIDLLGFFNIPLENFKWKPRIC